MHLYTCCITGNYNGPNGNQYWKYTLEKLVGAMWVDRLASGPVYIPTQTPNTRRTLVLLNIQHPSVQCRLLDIHGLLDEGRRVRLSRHAHISAWSSSGAGSPAGPYIQLTYAGVGWYDY